MQIILGERRRYTWAPMADNTPGSTNLREQRPQPAKHALPRAAKVHPTVGVTAANHSNKLSKRTHQAVELAGEAVKLAAAGEQPQRRGRSANGPICGCTSA